MHQQRCMAPQKSIEYGGLGQSGYTAGRREHDHALERELEAEYVGYPRGADEEMLKDELGTDDRFTGRGGAILHDHAPKRA
jgi:hypothetical protein